MSKQRVTGTTHENLVAAKAQAHGLEARRQPGSGIYKEYPSDVLLDQFLLECKVRSPLPTIDGNEKAVRVEYNWLNKVMRNAKTLGKLGAVVVKPKGQQKQMVLMDFDDWLELVKLRQQMLHVL